MNGEGSKIRTPLIPRGGTEDQGKAKQATTEEILRNRKIRMSGPREEGKVLREISHTKLYKRTGKRSERKGGRGGKREGVEKH